MSFPLIQQPSPLQQLAVLVQGLRQQAMERQQAMSDQRRRDAYLALNQQEFAAGQANRQREFANADRAYNFEVDQSKLRTGERARAMEMEQAQLNQANLNNLIAQGRASVPEQYTIGVESAIDLAKGRPITGLLQGAQANAQQGLSGSVARQRRIGQAGDVFFDPGTVNVNYPTHSTTDERGTERDRLGLANASALVGALQGLERLERNDPTNAVRPFGGLILRGLASRAGRLAAGDEGAIAAENIGRTNEQTTYQSTAEQWAHNYIPNLPGFRMSVPMFHSIQRAFFVPPGESDPAVIADAARRRREVTEGIVLARQRGLSEAQIAQMVVNQLRSNGAGHAAGELETYMTTGGENATNATGQPVGIPAAGSSVPRRNRFMP